MSSFKDLSVKFAKFRSSLLGTARRKRRTASPVRGSDSTGQQLGQTTTQSSETTRQPEGASARLGTVRLHQADGR